MQDFRDLRIWKRAVDINTEIYLISGKFPRHEAWGLTNQIRRASVSIASNIAEGRGRKTDKDFSHFLYISRGSINEVLTQLIIAKNLEYFSHEEYIKLDNNLDILNKMLSGFIKFLGKNN